jgi:hypothetical protein
MQLHVCGLQPAVCPWPFQGGFLGGIKQGPGKRGAITAFLPSLCARRQGDWHEPFPASSRKCPSLPAGTGPQGNIFQMGMPGGSNAIYLSKQQASGSNNPVAASPHPPHASSQREVKQPPCISRCCRYPNTHIYSTPAASAWPPTPALPPLPLRPQVGLRPALNG